MSPTPEQWKALDAAERAYRANELPAGVESVWDELLAPLMEEHARALIDAARPKCERCKGSGSWPRVTRQCCPDCNGTGWAA